MKNFQRKMIAPFLITLAVILYYILYFLLLVTMLDGILKWFLGVIPLLLAVVMVMVCKERIDEIKKGEDNDLGQY